MPPPADLSTTATPADASAAAKPWPRPAFVGVSAGVHAGALAAAWAVPGAGPWALGAVALNHAVLTGAGLWPRSRLLGPNLLRLPPGPASQRAVCLTLDDGPDPEVTPQVLDLLDQYQAKATFFVIAERAQQHPEIVAAMVARGHSVQNHSHVHSHGFSTWGMGRIEQELRDAQEALQKISGSAPRYFRAPAGFRNPFLEPVLTKLGLQLVSWTRRGYDTRVRDARVVVNRLLPALSGGAILLLHDGNAARDAQGQSIVLQVLPMLLEVANQRGLHAVTLPQGMHP